jgi:ATP-dependent helicase/nuclease subunit B
VIGAILDEAAARGVVVHRGLLDPLGVDMTRDFDELLKREAESGDGFVPSEFEKEFADVAFRFGAGREMSFRGKLDRVDVAQAPPRVRVVDYKTGGFRFEDGQEWKGGTELQLALYNLAAESLYPQHEVIEAQYRFVSEKGGFNQKACPNSTERRETLRAILGRLDALAAAGIFAPSADNCTFCDYLPICGPLREARAQRKAADPRLAEFRLLRQIP